jgi:hypothetical protein
MDMIGARVLWPICSCPRHDELSPIRRDSVAGHVRACPFGIE